MLHQVHRQEWEPPGVQGKARKGRYRRAGRKKAVKHRVEGWKKGYTIDFDVSPLLMIHALKSPYTLPFKNMRRSKTASPCAWIGILRP
jgi:hypothetical protein